MIGLKLLVMYAYFINKQGELRGGGKQIRFCILEFL
jgi:hypothetical protein